MKGLLAVMAGGAIGSGLRYLVTLLLSGWSPLRLPAATFAVNMAGCLLLGVLTGALLLREDIPGPWKLMLTTGLCGGFTTFSTFAGETCTLLGQSAGLGLAYALGSVAGGVGLFALGVYLGR